VIDLTDKVAAYANALDSDIDAERFEQVRNRALWRGWIGTIYGSMVGTNAGYAFPTKSEAVGNARLAREQCRDIVRARNAGGAEHA
jgi:hypothetical protein